ncbi:hypothetical protein SNEBB_011207 [Seison nebaliae]|nr:hypothetical protein SNEBB_011207 [Seison nebaliae]
MSSCDTFAVRSTNGKMIFGKNSDRPAKEKQYLFTVPRQYHDEGSKLKCTYTEIDQVPETFACVLSCPEWCWGAEMGSNEFGVTIGNEALFSRFSESMSDDGLVGMDIVRIALERSMCASDAVKVIAGIYADESIKIGGKCAEDINLRYCNAYLICDSKKLFVLESAGRYVAYKEINADFYNISNGYTITTDYDCCSFDPGDCRKKFNFQQEFSDHDYYTESLKSQPESWYNREKCGRETIQNIIKRETFTQFSAFQVLRKFPLARTPTADFTTTASQVSKISSDNVNWHWFTLTPNPENSLFKPFVFTQPRCFTLKKWDTTLLNRIHSNFWKKSTEAAKRKMRERLRRFEEQVSMNMKKTFPNCNCERSLDATLKAEISMYQEY